MASLKDNPTQDFAAVEDLLNDTALDVMLSVSMLALQMEDASEPAVEVLPSPVRAETPSPVVDPVLSSSSSSDTAGASTSVCCASTSADSMRQVQSSAWTDEGSPVVVQAPATTSVDTTFADGQLA